MSTTKALERAALAAHRAGQTWAEFWQRHGDAVRQAEPHDRQRFHRLLRRLSALLLCGNSDGHEPLEVVEPWEKADSEASKPSDTATAARCLWPGPQK